MTFSVPDHARGYESFAGRVGRTMSESRPAWPAERRPQPGAPNVVVVLVDDLGYSDFSPYGSEIHTPTVQRLADNGVQFANYHTTPLCSPTRAALLTGVNAHRAGFAFPANLDPGYPSYAFALPDNAPTLAESFRAAGYATYMVGKWHLTRDGESHDAADRSSWPLQRGFDRYFGSLEGFTSLHAPHRLISDNSQYEVESYPDGYFLTDDLTDRAIGMLHSLRANDDEKPFFLYFAHHAVHGPIQGQPEDIEKYRGVYESGWDEIRRSRFGRQIERGLFGPDTELPPPNFEPGKDVPAWDDLTSGQKERLARYMAVYAASVDNLDQNLARLLDTIADYGELDNTIVVVASDNGASGEGGPLGTRSYFSQFASIHGPGFFTEPDGRSIWDTDVERDLDLIGGPQTAVHYPRGWAQASCTPFRLYKSDTYNGGLLAPLVISWPASDLRGLRRQYVDVTDLAPTLLELAGIDRPDSRNGLPAMEIDGVSAVNVMADPAASSRHPGQYMEMTGNRSFVDDGWKIVTNHRPGAAFDDSEWALYHVASDPTEVIDRAGDEPDRLLEMAAAWEREAWRNAVFPLNDHSPAALLRRPAEDRMTRPVTIRPGTPTLERYRAARLIQLRSWAARIEFEHAAGDRGVLVAHGDQGGGYVVYVEDGAAHLAYNAYGAMLRTEPVVLGPGVVTLDLVAAARPEFRWHLLLSTGDAAAELDSVPQLVAMAPFTGISVGADRGGPVDWAIHERAGSYPYTGTLRSVRYEPGQPADYDPREVARLWAEAAQIFD